MGVLYWGKLGRLTSNLREVLIESIIYSLEVGVESPFVRRGYRGYLEWRKDRNLSYRYHSVSVYKGQLRDRNWLTGSNEYCYPLGVMIGRIRDRGGLRDGLDLGLLLGMEIVVRGLNNRVGGEFGYIERGVISDV